MTKLTAWLLGVALLSVGMNACGGSSKGTGSSSRASSSVLATGSTTATGTAKAPPSPNSLVENHLPYSLAEARFFRSSGHRADARTVRQVGVLVKRYYAAASAGDYARACRLIYPSVAKAAPEDYGQQFRQHHLYASTCPTFLSLLFKYRNGKPAAELTAIRVTSVRISKQHAGIAFLRAPGMASGEIMVQREGKFWKLLQLLGNALPA